MAGLVVQSRFAGLKIEDDDYPSSSDVQKGKKPKPNSAKKPEPPKKQKPTPAKTQNNNKKKKSKPVPPTSDQWEQWKQKDEELVDGNFESELQQAILLSKLDYEEKKDVYKQFKKEAELEKKYKQEEKSSKKQKKKNVMSLDQFNDMMNTGEEPRHNHEEESKTVEVPKSPDKDTEFFSRVRAAAQSELLRDKIIERVRRQAPDEVITRVHFADALEKKDAEIAALREEVSDLKQELLTVKSRNRKLCNILGQGEMKDKASVLVEVERLRGVQAELTAELAALHTDLERERSRHDPRPANKKKKGANTEKEK